MYVCLCKAVTDTQIVAAVEEGAVAVSHLEETCGLGTGCGRCRDFAQQIIDDHLAETNACAA